MSALSDVMYIVASYMGAWIETVIQLNLGILKQVASYMGAWIETPLNVYNTRTECSRILHGCVD